MLEDDRCVARLSVPPRRGAHAGRQFVGVDRRLLHVVGAMVEQPDSSSHGARLSHHDHRHSRVYCAQVRQPGHGVEPRQGVVQHDAVERTQLQGRRQRTTVCQPLHDDALGVERRPKRRRQRRVGQAGQDASVPAHCRSVENCVHQGEFRTEGGLASGVAGPA
jgi:hypothetical protein